ncbi:MAG: PAS domain-containing protein, partial [Gammaproteobacteria bacterium]
MKKEHEGMADHVLIVGGDPAEAKAIGRILLSARDGPFHVERVAQLSDGLERLGKGGIGAVLLDLLIPDSQGIESLDRLLLAAPNVPILVLSSPGDQDIARQAIQRGAQDYLPKDHLDSYSLPRAVRHVIARKAVEEALFEEKERGQITLNSISDAVVSTDIAGNISYVNRIAEKMTGWSREEASGRHIAEVVPIIDGATREPIRNPVALAVQQDKTVNLAADSILIRRDGSESAIEDSAAPIHDREGRVTGAVMVFHDVSEARAVALKMSHLAEYDFLTNLPNRI